MDSLWAKENSKVNKENKLYKERIKKFNKLNNKIDKDLLKYINSVEKEKHQIRL